MKPGGKFTARSRTASAFAAPAMIIGPASSRAPADAERIVVLNMAVIDRDPAA